MDLEPELWTKVMVQVDLVAVEISSGRLLPCVVTTSESTESCGISVSLDESDAVQGRGYDFEEALKVLRAQLEARGLHLLCNRFRRAAYVTSLSRQMSRGLGCYLVVPRRPVDPAQIVVCLGAASQSDVVSAEIAEVFIAKWKARPSILVLLMLAKRGLRRT
jgi:hypothetical protein